MNGTTNAMENAMSVGRTNIGKYFFNDACMRKPFCGHRSRDATNHDLEKYTGQADAPTAWALFECGLFSRPVIDKISYNLIPSSFS